MRHTVEGYADGRYEAIWRDRIEPVHDVELEALFDHVQAAIDEAPREVGVPADLAAALAADPQAAASFERMAFTHRKEYARWIAEAKRTETRQRRVAQAVEMIRAGQTRS